MCYFFGNVSVMYNHINLFSKKKTYFTTEIKYCHAYQNCIDVERKWLHASRRWRRLVDNKHSHARVGGISSKMQKRKDAFGNRRKIIYPQRNSQGHRGRPTNTTNTVRLKAHGGTVENTHNRHETAHYTRPLTDVARNVGRRRRRAAAVMVLPGRNTGRTKNYGRRLKPTAAVKNAGHGQRGNVGHSFVRIRRRPSSKRIPDVTRDSKTWDIPNTYNNIHRVFRTETSFVRAHSVYEHRKRTWKTRHRKE